MTTKRGGRRCVVGACTNGFETHTKYTIQTQKDELIRREWCSFVETTRSDFRRSATTVYICDIHFMDECFQASQWMQFRCGFRKSTPELNQGAIPSIRIPSSPASASHFIRPSNTPSPMTTTATCKKRRRSKYLAVKVNTESKLRTDLQYRL
jgi:hypothetical protein